MKYDVCIIGAGVIGSFIARQLSKYDMKVVVIERNVDVAMNASGANSGIIHAGYDAKPGMMKSRFNVTGCKMMPKVCEDLKVKFNKCGSFVLAFNEEGNGVLDELYRNGINTGVEGLSIVDRDFVISKEPNVNPAITKALYARDAGVISPYKLNIAAMENAIINGVRLIYETNVKGIVKKDGLFNISTEKTGSIRSNNKIDGYKKSEDNNITANVVINAAGTHSDEISAMVGDDSFRIIPRRGQYILFDKTEGNMVSTVLFQTPTSEGKGILVTPTSDGNLLIGPDASVITDKDGKCTTYDDLDQIYRTALKTCAKINLRKAITVFSGIRSTPDTGDFIIGESSRCKGFINVAGIESPGLTSSPAIAEYVEEIVKGIMDVRLKDKYMMTLEHHKAFYDMTIKEKEEICNIDPGYRKIICRCETVTEKEVRNSIHAHLGARTVDGVKRRTRAGMGRCQGGFCSPHVMRILSEELGIPLNKIVKSTSDSCILGRYSRD